MNYNLHLKLIRFFFHLVHIFLSIITDDLAILITEYPFSLLCLLTLHVMCKLKHESISHKKPYQNCILLNQTL